MNIPKLRFKGFNDEWKDEKLEEVANVNARIGWQNLRTSEFLNDGNYYLITGTDFQNGKINFKTCHYISKNRYEQDKKIQLSIGSILITKDGTLGKVAYINKLPKPATLNAGVFNILVKNKNVIDSIYLYTYLNAPFLMTYATMMSTGGTIKHLNKNILINFPIVFPANKAEQQKIGALFAKLDNLIDLQVKKLELLKQLKQGLLQKLFPQNNQTTPQLRFKGFNEEWKEEKLSNITERLDNLRIPIEAAKRIKGNIPYYGANGIQDFVKGFTHNGKYILIAEDGANSVKDYPIYYVEGKFWANNHVHVIDFKKGNKEDCIFLSYSLKTKNLKPYLVGGTRFKLTANDLMKIKVKITQKQEQQKIGSLLANLDNLLTKAQEKITLFKQVKKYLLQRMFI